MDCVRNAGACLAKVVTCPFRGWPFGAVPRSKPIESADYSSVNNARARAYASADYRRFRQYRGFLRWTIFFLVGIACSGLYRIIFYLIDLISEKKFDLLNDRLENSDIATAFWTYFVVMLVLVIGSMLFVLWAPSAGGGGVPEVICALNGAWENGLFTVKTMFAKSSALILAVASGLALGPEGPFIHLGAILGPLTMSVCVWLLSQTRLLRSPASDLMGPIEERNFIVVGAAVGVAVAFRAPIGGVLFVLEEAISFFDARLIFRVYFSCAVAYYALQIMIQGHNLITSTFTEYGVKVHCDLGYEAEDLVLFALLGVFGGLLGALFNRIVVLLAQKRAKYISKYGYRRMFDAAALCLITTFLVVFVPTRFQCTPASHLYSHVPEFESMVVKHGNDTIFMGNNEVCLSDTAWSYFRMSGGNLTKNEDFMDYFYLNSVNCPAGTYNEMASLMQTMGKNTVTLLFSNGSYDMFGLWSLGLFLTLYFFMAAITASLSVPAGMVVPSLIIGGTMGRIMAILVNMSFKKWVDSSAVDPGSWAMVGAAAFWCGSARITVTVAVIIMEITGDFRYIPAIAMAVMFAKLTGQFFTDSVYHMIIHIKKIPFMEDIPARVMDDTFVQDIMVPASRIVSVPVVGEESSLRGALSTSHNGFPVTEEKAGKVRLVGLVSRSQMREAMRSSDARMDGNLINLRNFMNETPITLLPSFTMTQAFKMFRTLGLRHLVVINENFEVEGLLTRECFMDHYIEQKKKENAFDARTEEDGYYLVEDPSETELDSQLLDDGADSDGGGASGGRGDGSARVFGARRAFSSSSATPLLGRADEYTRGPSGAM